MPAGTFPQGLDLTRTASLLSNHLMQQAKQSEAEKAGGELLKQGFDTNYVPTNNLTPQQKAQGMIEGVQPQTTSTPFSNPQFRSAYTKVASLGDAGVPFLNTYEKMRQEAEGKIVSVGEGNSLVKEQNNKITPLYVAPSNKTIPQANVDYRNLTGSDGKEHTFKIINHPITGQEISRTDMGVTYQKPTDQPKELPAINWNLSGDAFLKDLESKDPSLSRFVKDVADNKISISSAPTRQFRGGKGFNQQDIEPLVTQYKPEWNATQYPTAQRTNTEYTSGVTGRNIVSLNTAMKHVSQMNDLAYNLQNGNTQAANYAKNKIKAWFGSSVPTNVESLAPMVSSEVAKMLTGVGITNQTQIEHVLGLFSIAKSHAQLADGIKEALKLTKGRAEELRQGYERGIGSLPNFKVVSPDNVEMFKKFGLEYNEGEPQQITKITTDQEYDKLPSGTMFLDPNGIKRRKP
jgi:hypothetical protein